MSLKIFVYRGTDEIGGNCVEIASGATRILFDVGQPLSGEDVVLSDAQKNVDAVVISHPHQDHFGLLQQMPEPTPVYMGATGVKLIQATRIFLGHELFKNDFRPIVDRVTFHVGDLAITPYLVDHSAFDAFSLLVEGSGNRVFYTGDIRMHGRKQSLMEKIIADPPPAIDTLIIEGTMLDRTNFAIPSEKDAEQAMTDLLLSTEGAGFLICSSQNLDRLVTAYRACLRSDRIFVIDIYTAWVLRQIDQDPRTAKTPDLSWERIRVLAKGFTAGRHYKTIKSNRDYFGSFPAELYEQGNVITHEEIAAQPSRFLIKNPRPLWLIDTLGLKPCAVIYSMWEGYLQEEYNPTGWRRFKALKDDPQIEFEVIHTSGHAVLSDLKRLTKALNPKEIIPIHTEDGDRLAKLLRQP